MNFPVKFPFLIWTSIVIIGLIAGIGSNDYVFQSSIFFLIFTFFLLILKVNQHRYLLFFGTSLFLLGMVHMQTNFPKENQFLENESESFFVAKINEQLRTGGEWVTQTAIVESVYKNGTWQKVDEKILLITESSIDLVRKNDRLLLKSTFSKIENKGNPGEFDAEYYWLSKGVRNQSFGFSGSFQIIETAEPTFWNSLLENVRNYSNNIIDKLVPEKIAALTKAILLGNKSDLDVETKNQFANSGAMHVLAVSGLHVGIIAYLLNGLFQFLFHGNKRKWAVILLILTLWFYAFLTGLSASVTRAVFMFSVLIASQLIQRQYSPLNTLAFTALVLLIWNPLTLFDIGFQLSFLAMVGIFTMYDKIERVILPQQLYLKKLWQGTAIGLAAQVFTVPVSIYYFHQFPNYFILSNIGVMLFSSLILGLGIAILVVGKIPYLNQLVGVGLIISVSALIYVIEWVDQLPGAVALGLNPSLAWVLLIYFLILVVTIYFNRIKFFFILGLFAPLIIWLQSNRYENLTQSQLCVFNANQLTMVITKNNQHICFYSNKEKGLKIAQRLMMDYQRIYPGETRFEEIDRNEFNLKDAQLDFQLKAEPTTMRLVLNEKHYTLVKSTKYWVGEDKDQKAKMIIAPYIQNYSKAYHRLNEGSLVISI